MLGRWTNGVKNSASDYGKFFCDAKHFSELLTMLFKELIKHFVVLMCQNITTRLSLQCSLVCSPFNHRCRYETLFDSCLLWHYVSKYRLVLRTTSYVCRWRCWLRSSVSATAISLWSSRCSRICPSASFCRSASAPFCCPTTLGRWVATWWAVGVLIFLNNSVFWSEWYCA